MLNPTLSLLLAQTRQRELLDEAERNRTPLTQPTRARAGARRAWLPGPPRARHSDAPSAGPGCGPTRRPATERFRLRQAG